MSSYFINMTNIAETAGLIASVGSLIGAFVLWRKSRPEANKLQAEAKKAVAEESKLRTENIKQEVDIIRETYSHMLDDQLKSVVAPMESRIDKLSKSVDELQKKNDSLQRQVDELRVYRTIFEDAVLYIRSLCHWIDTINIPKDTKPKLPHTLRSYFQEEKA